MRARKGWAAVFAALVMTAVQAANLSVTDVKIAQRYPWNGLVDITYTVNCDDPNKDVWVYPVGYDADTQTSVALMPEYLSGAGASNAVHNGTHQMTWNMAKQMGKDYNRAAFSVTLHAYCDAAPYMVIDLSAGSKAEKYDVTYLGEIPEGGWTDEYKTTKMVFRLILPGGIGNGSTTTLTKPYYFGVFPITLQQWCLVDGGNTPGTGRKSGVSYDMLRGNVLGARWPEHQQVDATSFIGKMRLRTGITIDLPTVAQWYRAARAGGVRTKVSDENPWGICGVGAGSEWCLDWGSDTYNHAYNYFEENAPSGGVDPIGRSSNYHNARVVCGMEYSNSEGNVPSLSGYEGCTYTLPQGGGSAHYFTSGMTEASWGAYISMDRCKYSFGFSARLVALPVCK